MQRAMIDASQKSGSRKPVAREANRDKWVEFQELAGSAQEPLWRLAQEVHSMIKQGTLMALRRFDRDDAPFADLGFECQKGRHRSLFIGDLTA
eukprot:15384972-Alexandrium_andersonii.AAC.1